MRDRPESETDKQRDRQTESEPDRERYRQIERQTVSVTDRE